MLSPASRREALVQRELWRSAARVLPAFFVGSASSHTAGDNNFINGGRFEIRGGQQAIANPRFTADFHRIIGRRFEVKAKPLWPSAR